MSKPSKSENVEAIDEMRPEYDFTDAERGKFYRANAVVGTPVRLEPEVLAYLQARAEARGVSLSRIVNDLLKKDIELIEAVR
jgi:predicted HicB family RNase H-like nuclease